MIEDLVELDLPRGRADVAIPPGMIEDLATEIGRLAQHVSRLLSLQG